MDDNRFKWPVVPHPDVDLYSLAMELRGVAEGSAELASADKDLRHNAAYLRARLDVWGTSFSPSEALFRDMLEMVLREVKEQVPWILEPQDE